MLVGLQMIRASRDLPLEVLISVPGLAPHAENAGNQEELENRKHETGQAGLL